jgi:peptide/nickel transport system permease protein
VFFGTSFTTVVLIIGLLRWMPVARMLRAGFLQHRGQDYVLAARALGATSSSLMWRHILPNAIGPVVVAATLGVGGAILTESALSFLGLGIQLPTPSWGNMLRTSQPSLTTAPWLALAPGLFIFVTILSVNYIGDGLRDALDPHG